MARNSDRHISEGGGLNAGDLGAPIPEAEDRLPAWAQQREQEAAPAREETPPEESQDAPEEENAGVSSEAEARKAADEAWSREATRVEGGQYRRGRAPGAESAEEEPAKSKKSTKKVKKC